MKKFKSLIKFEFVTIFFFIFATQQSAVGWIKFEEFKIDTPLGTPVTVYKYVGTWSDSQLLAQALYWEEEMKKFNPNDVKIRDEPTRKYNCHGYAWYMSEGRPNDMVEMPYPQAFWEDGSYVEIEEYEAVEGDKVVYFCKDEDCTGLCTGRDCDKFIPHSAVVADVPGWVISKWEDGPLVRHRLKTVPEHYPTDKLKFYRKFDRPQRPKPPSNLRIIGMSR